MFKKNVKKTQNTSVTAKSFTDQVMNHFASRSFKLDSPYIADIITHDFETISIRAMKSPHGNFIYLKLVNRKTKEVISKLTVYLSPMISDSIKRLNIENFYNLASEIDKTL